MELTQIRASDGLQHGLINTVSNSVPFNGFKRFAEKDRPAMEKKSKEEEKIVEAQYLNKNGKNERLEKPYMHWEGQPITTWRFIHGCTYFVPKGLVDEVNNPIYRQKKRTGLLDEKGRALESDEYDELEHRFVPVGF